MADGKIEVTHVYHLNSIVGPAIYYCVMSQSADGKSRGIAMEVDPSDPRAAQGAGAQFSIVYTSAVDSQSRSDGRFYVFVTEENHKIMC